MPPDMRNPVLALRPLLARGAEYWNVLLGLLRALSRAMRRLPPGPMAGRCGGTRPHRQPVRPGWPSELSIRSNRSRTPVSGSTRTVFALWLFIVGLARPAFGNQGSFLLEDNDSHAFKLRAPLGWDHELNYELANPTGAPAGSYVTTIDYRFVIIPTTGIYAAAWRCDDYAVGLLPQRVYDDFDGDIKCYDPWPTQVHCPGVFYSWAYFWRHDGGRTDVGLDDDTDDDEDIDVDYRTNSYRSTIAFHGEDPNQGWHMQFRNRSMEAKGVLTSFALQVNWQNDGPVIGSLTTTTHPITRPSNQERAHFHWSDVVDANGVAGYSIWVDHEPSTIPDSVAEVTPGNSVEVDITPSKLGWYFHIHAVDGLGNWGGDWGNNTLHYGPFYVDTESPGPLVISSPSHPLEGGWFNNNDPSFEWTQPADQSAIRGYSYLLSQTSILYPDATLDTEERTVQFTDKPDGRYFFDVRAQDAAGNWGSIASYEFGIDTVGPPAPCISSPTHPDQGVVYSNDSPTFNWTRPPNLSGIDCYSIAFDRWSNTVPPEDCRTTLRTASFEGVLNGTWYLHVRAKSKAGIWSDEVAHFPVNINAPLVPPVADAGGPYAGVAGQSLQFDGTGSDDPDGTIVSYTWDFGDGASGVGPAPSHVYESPGTFLVILTVTDNKGLSHAAGAIVNVVPQDPGSDAHPGVLVIALDGPGALLLEWNSAPTHSYAVEYSPNLGAWSTIAVVSATDSTSFFRDADPARVGPAAAFYRIRLLLD